MPPELVILRHAKSDWSGGQADLHRPLARRGRRQASEAGRWLAARKRAVDLALVSPAERTRATWSLVAAELASVPPSRVDDRLYGATADELLAVLREVPDEQRTVVVVGHNPGVEDLVHRLTGEPVELPTSAIAVVDGWNAWATVGDEKAVLRASGRPPR